MPRLSALRGTPVWFIPRPGLKEEARLRPKLKNGWGGGYFRPGSDGTAMRDSSDPGQRAPPSAWPDREVSLAVLLEYGGGNKVRVARHQVGIEAAPHFKPAETRLDEVYRLIESAHEGS
jgi:hypothetical protein